MDKRPDLSNCKKCGDILPLTLLLQCVYIFLPWKWQPDVKVISPFLEEHMQNLLQHL